MRSMLVEFRARLIGAFLSVLAVVGFGTVGYYMLGAGRWTIEDCLYMTVITVTTVGFGEILDFQGVAHVRLFTLLLIIMGMGVFLYFASTVTAFIIEGHLRRALESSYMRKKIAKLKDHIIVCGAGSTGCHVIKELMATQTPMVAVDQHTEQLEELAREYDSREFVYVAGDATDDHVLEAAGISRAAGLVAALASDKDNLYLVVSAQQLHPTPDNFRIVARGSELSVLAKLKKAGAHSVVSPNFIGGMRLASEMIRPTVVKFMDDMLRDDATVRLEEVLVTVGADIAGKSIRDLDLRKKHNVSVLALKTVSEQHYTYNPTADHVIEPGTTLVVLGANSDVESLRDMATG